MTTVCALGILVGLIVLAAATGLLLAHAREAVRDLPAPTDDAVAVRARSVGQRS